MVQPGPDAAAPPPDHTLPITDFATSPEHTLAVPQEHVDATIADSPGAGATFIQPDSAVDAEATQNVSTPSAFHPESAVQTLIGEPSQDPHATFAEIQATAGSSSVARGWAPTKGASGGNWSEQSRAAQPNAAPRTHKGPRTEERYKLLDNFAHGGLGNIWLAEDTSIHRQIAFKELLPKALKNKSVVERFMEEAQITGQLEHPCIVPIYDVGYQENGTPFYAMKLLKGGNMEKAIEEMTCRSNRVNANCRSVLPRAKACISSIAFSMLPPLSSFMA